ncbi:Metallo-peptidase family M12-domain-containing protein [Umbelopsis sp. AD052]|nr:Metallo-peptidase family M12-domain-containing protein [Umbelopsis sp. AD052]
MNSLRERLWSFHLIYLVIIIILPFSSQEGLAHSQTIKRLARLEPIVLPTLIISPRQFVARDISPNPNYIPPFTSLKHDDSFHLQFQAYNSSILLSLSPNIELFHPDASTVVVDSSGEEVISPLHHEDYRIYKGEVLDTFSTRQELGWARIIIRHDIDHSHPHPLFEGAFSIGPEIFHIKTKESFNLAKRSFDPHDPSDSPLIIYRDSDMLDMHSNDHHLTTRNSNSPAECAADETAFNQRKLTGRRITNTLKERSLSDLYDPTLQFWSSPKKYSTMTKRADIYQGCPKSRLINYMGAAADCTYTAAYQGIQNARIQMINDWNTASSVYERTFNVSLGIVQFYMMTPVCPTTVSRNLTWNQNCSSSYTINSRLSDFSIWRGSKGEDGAGLWHLMTQCFTGVKVGIAWLSQLCETGASEQLESDGSSEWVSGTGVSSITLDEWKVVAHEIGHGFGAIHDCTAQLCPCSGDCNCCPLSTSTCDSGGTYIMNPTSNVSTNNFSPCSVADICSSLPNIGYCLQVPGTKKVESFAMCGNGILEPGEECDPGGVDDACCFGATCKLKPGAVCDDYNQACCKNCSLSASGTLCRAPISTCDLPEYCNGTSTACPTDIHLDDGTSCANGTMKCASGMCTSRSAQCALRGARLNITEECSFQQDSCQISCADPSDPHNCLALSGMFLDGTDCGLAGRCLKGQCKSTGALNTAKAWINQNKQIAIPVITVGSIIILLLLARCSWWLRSYTRRRKRLTKEKDSRPPSIVSNPPEGGTDGPPGYAGFRSSQLSRLEVGNRRTVETLPIESPLPVYGGNRSTGASNEEWEMQVTSHHSRSSSVAPVPSLHNQDEESSQSSRSINFRSSNPGSVMTTPVSRRMHAVSIASADSDTYLPPKHDIVNISDHPQDSVV